MDVLLAIICGILYFLAKSKIGYTLTTALGSGIFIGFILGLYFNDLASGLIIGASIQLIYLGVIHTGGNEPSDGELASIIAIPIALQTGLDASAAVHLRFLSAFWVFFWIRSVVHPIQSGCERPIVMLQKAMRRG